MNREEQITSRITDIIQIARLAPSVHNSQPWKIKLHDNHIQILVDEKHKLHEGDPTGRQTFISLGIFYEAFLMTADKYYVQVTDFQFNDNSIKANVELKKRKSVHSNLIDYLDMRCSDRSIYQSVLINENAIRSIKRNAINDHVEIKVITDQHHIEEIADLTSRGISLALQNPSFREELCNHLVLPWSNNSRGITVKSLYINPILEIMQPFLLKHGFSLNQEAELENRRWRSASAVICLLADGDMKEFWFDVGRTYLKTSLTIASLDYSQATSAALVEASNYHEDIQKMLDTNKRLLAVMRIGKGSAKKYFSPRAPVTTLLTLR